MKGDLLIWTAGVTIFAAYLRTLSPSISGGDSGEIVAEGCELGVAHPPGYPLLTVIIFAISRYVPIEYTVAKSVNILSAALTSIAAVFLGYSVKALSPKGGVFGAIFGMGLFSFSPLIWQYAVTAEVFPLNTMFAAWIVYLVISFSRNQRLSTAYWGALVCGLAGCNQHTIVLYEVPLILWMLVLLRNQIIQRPVIVLFLGLAFLCGLAPYLYLPFSELFNPQPGAWGHVASLAGFLHHILRRDYGTFQLFSGSTSKPNENMWQRHLAYIKDATEIQSPIFVKYFALLGLFVCAVYGTGKLNALYGIENEFTITENKTKRENNSPFLSLGKKGKKGNKNDSLKLKAKQTVLMSASSNMKEMVADGEDNETSNLESWTPLVLVFTQIFYFSFFHSLANLPLSDRLLYGVHQRFWMQPNVLFFCWAGIGFNVMASIALEGSKKLASSSRLLQQAGALSLQLVALIMAVLCVHYQWWRMLPLSDQSGHSYFQQYAQAVLSPIPAKAIFMINYDQQWTSVRYMQVCEGFQSQVVSMHMSLMTYPWFYHKRELYAQQNNMSFPGTYLTATTGPNAKAKIERDHAFTMSQFLDVNIPAHRVYIGGKFIHGDAQVSSKYDLIPVGLVSQIAPLGKLPNGWEYSHMCRASWERVLSFLPMLPNTQKYSEETWEWTIGRDMKDRLGDSAAYLLERILRDIEADKQNSPNKHKKATTRSDVTDDEHDMLVQPLVDAVYWLETAFAYETQRHNQHKHSILDVNLEDLSPLVAPASLLKNLGLAHVHLLQDSRLQLYESLPSMSKDIFNSTTVIGWQSNR